MTRVAVVRAQLVDRALGDLPRDTVVIVTDPDGARAAEAAGRITAHRTAVFVGDLDNPTDFAAIEELANELFGKNQPIDLMVIGS